MKKFLKINMVISYLRYVRSIMYWSSEEGLGLDLISNARLANRFQQILRNFNFIDITHKSQEMLMSSSKSDQCQMHSRKPSIQQSIPKNFNLLMSRSFPSRATCLSSSKSQKTQTLGSESGVESKDLCMHVQI